MADAPKPWEQNWGGGTTAAPADKPAPPSQPKPWQQDWSGKATVPAGATAQDFPIDTAKQPPGFLAGEGIDPGASGRGVREAVKAGEPKTVTLADPKFDVTTGLSFDLTRIWKTLDNDAERKKFLENGKSTGEWTSYGQTTDTGQWYVVKDDKPIAIEGGGHPIRDIGAGIAAHPGETIGMAASALIPEARIPEMAGGALAKAGVGEAAAALWKVFSKGSAYNVGRAALTGVGAAAGKGVDEVTKAVQGLFEKSAKEEASSLGASAIGAMLAELGIRSTGSLVRAVRQGYSKFIDPEVQAQVAGALREGVKPSVAQAAPPAKLLPFEQAMTQRIFGNPAEKGNIKVMQTKIVDNLVASGWTRPEAERLATQMSAGTRDLTAPGEALASGAQQRVERSAADVEVQGEGLRQDLNAQLATIDRNLGSTDPALQQQVQQDIIKARQTFGQQASDRYAEVDKAISGQEAYPSQGIRSEAQRIINAIPKDRTGKPLYAVPPDIAGAAQLPDMISFATAQRLRSSFERAGWAKDLTPGIEQREYGQLGEAVDAGFKQAAALPQGVGAGDAARALQAADDFYSQGIKKFQQVQVKQLGKEAEISHFADPEKVATAILRPGFSAQASRIKGLVSPETWKKVGAAYWNDIRGRATTPNLTAGGTPIIDGKKLLDQVTKAGKSLDVAYGPEVAGQMRDAAKRLAAMDGKLDPSGLSADNFRPRIEAYLRSQTQHEALMKNNFVQMLAGKSTVDRDEAVGYILKKPERISQAKSFYGAGSPEWKTIQKEGMAHILQSGVGPGGDLLSEVLKPGGLSGLLRGTNPRAIDELFGKDLADQLRALGRQIDFIAAKPKHSGTAAFAAAALVLHPLSHIGTLADLFTAGHIMSSGPFLRWLSLGLDGDTAAMKIAGDIARTVAYTTEPSTGLGGPAEQGIEAMGRDFEGDIRQGIKDPLGFRAPPLAPPKPNPVLDLLRGNANAATPPPPPPP